MAIIKYHIDDVTQPKDGRVCFLNRYWLCVDGDPTKAVFCGGNPQCNHNALIVERITQHSGNRKFACADLKIETNQLTVIHIPVAFVKL